MAEINIKKALTQNPSQLESDILKAIFKRNSAILEAIDIINENYFTISDYACIYKSMIELHNKGDNINCENVLLWLEQNGYGVEPNIVYKLFNESFTSIKIKTTCEILKELFIRRTILENMRNLIEEQEEKPTENDLILQRINSIAMKSNELVSVNTNDTKCCSDTNKIMADITSKLLQKVEVTGLKTGIPTIDTDLRGLMPTKLWTIVADSQVGKSALAVQLAVKACLLNPNIYVEYYSLEMDKTEVEQRAQSVISGIEPRYIDDPRKYFVKFDKETGIMRDYYEEGNTDMINEYTSKLKSAVDKLHSFNFIIDDTPDLDIMSLEARVKKNNIKNGKTDLIIVDHLGILCSGSASEVVGKMDEAYNKLKQMAKKLNCTVIALHQFSNELKNDPLRKPNIFALRGSAAPRHYSDIIAGIWRPCVYREVMDTHPELKNHCDIDWQKVRYTQKPEVTLMDYNGFMFTEKLPTQEQKSIIEGKKILTDDEWEDLLDDD